jgi:hypothetical protein
MALLGRLFNRPIEPTLSRVGCFFQFAQSLSRHLDQKCAVHGVEALFP